MQGDQQEEEDDGSVSAEVSDEFLQEGESGSDPDVEAAIDMVDEALGRSFGLFNVVGVDNIRCSTIGGEATIHADY